MAHAELSPAQARELAERLKAAADAVERQQKVLPDSYAYVHGPGVHIRVGS